MRVAIVSTYQPRPCGIAVFSSDLRAALVETDSSLAVEIVSIIRDGPHAHPPEVVATIRQDVAGDYAAAASELRRRDVDVVLIEHEYGIFGGDCGSSFSPLQTSSPCRWWSPCIPCWRARHPARRPLCARCVDERRW